jgi:hypothetical protein
MEMKKNIIAVTFVSLAALGTMLLSSTVLAADSRQVWMGNSLVLRIRNDAGGYTAAQRVDALQRRANLLLQDGNDIPRFSVRKSGTDSDIFADNAFFMTVTPADGRANGTTSFMLANIWAQRLRTILPGVTMYKPGVGTAHLTSPGNALRSRTKRLN